MGVLTEVVKEAVNSDLSLVDKLMARADKPSAYAGLHQTLADIAAHAKQEPEHLSEVGDIAAMKRFFPTAKEEAAERALKALGVIGAAGVGTGALASLAQHAGAASRQRALLESIGGMRAMPRREMSVPFELPKAAMEKRAVDPATAGAAGLGAVAYGPKLVGAAGFDPSETVGRWARSAGDYIKDLFRATESPTTHPLFIPAALATGVAATYGSSKLTGALLKRLRKRRMQREIESARQEFQSALRAQHEESQLAGKAGVKYSCDINTAIDALSKAFASGELEEQFKALEKAAQDDLYAPEGGHVGAGNIALGSYLGLLALLGLGGIAGGYALGKKFDPERGRGEALRSALRRRQLAGPPQFVVGGPGEDEE